MKIVFRLGSLLLCSVVLYACAARPVPPPVDCKNNSDCITPNTQCTGGVCKAMSAACQTDGDCERGSVCKKGVCEPTTTCQTDQDCPAARACSKNKCSTTCQTNDNCAKGEWCRDSVCLASKDILCASNKDCPPDADCDTDAKSCSKIRDDNKPKVCKTVTDCRTNELCHNTKRACIPSSAQRCQLSSECPQGDVCSPQTQRCEPKPAASCTQDKDCNATNNEKCDTQTKLCVKPCTKNEDCSKTGALQCNAVSKTCVTACKSHADCSASLICDFKDYYCRTR